MPTLDTSPLKKAAIHAETTTFPAIIHPHPSSNPTTDYTAVVIDPVASDFFKVARILGFMGIQCEWKVSAQDTLPTASDSRPIDIVFWKTQNTTEEEIQSFLLGLPKNTQMIALVDKVAQPTSFSLAENHRFTQISCPFDPDQFIQVVEAILSNKSPGITK